MEKSSFNWSLTQREQTDIRDCGTIQLDCSECGSPLLVLQLVNRDGSDTVETTTLTRVVVQCGMCNGFSIVREVRGQFYPGSPSDDMAFEPTQSGIENAPEADVTFRAWTK